MHALRKGIRDSDGASVLSSRSSVFARLKAESLASESAMERRQQTAASEIAAFEHACGGKEGLRRCAARAVAEFLSAYASEVGVSARKVYYSFILAFVQRIETFRGTGEFMLGDTARTFKVFPLVAYSLMNPLTMHPDPIRRVLDLCSLLNDRMPSRGEMHAWTGTDIELRTTRLNARCAIPFAFGLDVMIPNEKLDFVIKAIVNGEIKSVRYFISFVSKDYVSDSEEEGEGEGEGDAQGEGEGEEEGGAGAGAGAGGAGAVTHESKEVEKTPVYMRPELSKREFRQVLLRIPTDRVFDFLAAFGFHKWQGNAITEIPSPTREAFIQEKPIVPPCRGSVLRAYCRSILSMDVDNCEPEIQTFSDCCCSCIPLTDSPTH